MSIVLEQLTKRYQGHSVVHDLSLEIAEGELFVLLGPSGSGKSTVLRMIAGLAEADAGRILLHGRDVTPLPPQRRGVGFVFQSYALFRGMSVADNIEFPLAIRKVGRGERRRRRDELLALVGLAGLGGRMPRQLSGGQQQRVALARALAHEPEVLLLDEPFGALDARIRTELRRTIRSIQKELGIAAIFVTHDQEEAFELADRLAVLSFGRLLEAGPPQELYLRPQTEFVATFLGSANLMVGETTRAGVRLGPVEFPLATERSPERVPEPRRVQVLFRPEDVAVKESEEALGYPLLGRAVVEQTARIGAAERLRLRLPPLAGVRPIAPDVPFGSDFALIDAVRSQHQASRYPLRAGDPAWVGVRRIHALVHPGLSLMLATDGTPASDKAADLGGRIARMAHARVTVLAADSDGGSGRRGGAQRARSGLEERLQREKERLGSGLASIEAVASPSPFGEALAEQAERRPVDLVALGLGGLGDRGAIARAEEALAAGPHHLLAVPETAGADLPSHLLICVAVGEPGKEDVLFAGRLARHLGAAATVLTVISAEAPKADLALADRFLAAAVRSLGRVGVAAEPAIRRGEPRTQILAAAAARAEPTLLVLGAPLGRERHERRAPELDGLVGDLLLEAKRPVLIIRSGAGLL